MNTNLSSAVPSSKPAMLSAKTLALALFSMTLGAFSLGMTEFVIMGLLPGVSADLNVSLSAAGQLITGYALGVAIGGPIMTLLTYGIPRKRLLIVLMFIFICGNLLAVLAPNYTVLMLARIVTALSHGTFFGVGSVIVAGLVRPERRASAIAAFMSGLTVANILGVPFGTFIGQQWGWKATFGTVAVLGFVSLIGMLALVPSMQGSRSGGVRQEIAVFRKPQVLLALGMTILGFGGVFTAFTYISPLLTDVTGFHESAVAYILVVFGSGVTLGNLIGGRLADRGLKRTLIAGLIVLIAVLLLFFAALENKWLTVAVVFLWGMASYIIVPSLQLRVMDMAKEAQTLASTMNHSAFNIGNAGGAVIGGMIVAGAGLHFLPVMSAVVTLGGLLLTVFSFWLERRTASRQQAEAGE